MRIVFTGGGTGGHFYPIIAVAEKVNKIMNENKILDKELYFLSPTETDKVLLKNNNIKYVKILAGKLRIYPSVQNIIDIIKTPFAILQSLFLMFKIYPDVVFSKGGYGAFPVVFAARVLFIPVIIHESDTVPGRVNRWSGKFARRIAVSYPEASKFFDLKKVANTGQPIRNQIQQNDAIKPKDIDIDQSMPTILVLGGSLGAKIINEHLIQALPTLLNDYNIIHQAGKNNIEETRLLTDYLLKEHPNRKRYFLYDFIDSEKMSYFGTTSSLIISRAGSTIFEIAEWETPSIIIPITESNGNHQRKNAFSYARRGACSVIEERNFTNHILASEIKRILDDKQLYANMKKAAKEFQTPDAANKIASEIIKLAKKH